MAGDNLHIKIIGNPPFADVAPDLPFSSAFSGGGRQTNHRLAVLGENDFLTRSDARHNIGKVRLSKVYAQPQWRDKNAGSEIRWRRCGRFSNPTSSSADFSTERPDSAWRILRRTTFF
jgi:hypothetical protein